jgi:hypothetical protein
MSEAERLMLRALECAAVAGEAPNQDHHRLLRLACALRAPAGMHEWLVRDGVFNTALQPHASDIVGHLRT